MTHVQQGILTGKEIRRLQAEGQILITPFSEELVNECSVDVRLGRQIALYKGTYHPGSYPDGRDMRPRSHRDGGQVLDMAGENQADHIMMPESGFFLWPGIFYLGHTMERVEAPQLVMELTGKSGIARMGIKVHFTAGLIEPGFDGQVTLEIEALLPVRVFPGQRIGQLVFTTLVGEIESYQTRGTYVREAAFGPQPSRAYKQFAASPKPAMPRAIGSDVKVPIKTLVKMLIEFGKNETCPFLEEERQFIDDCDVKQSHRPEIMLTDADHRRLILLHSRIT